MPPNRNKSARRISFNQSIKPQNMADWYKLMNPSETENEWELFELVEVRKRIRATGGEVDTSFFSSFLEFWRFFFPVALTLFRIEVIILVQWKINRLFRFLKFIFSGFH